MINLKPISEVTVLFIDYGNSISMAQKLAKDCKKVYYATNWQTGFPKWNQYSVGMNVPNIERVDHWAEVYNECDLIVMPDLYLGSLADLFVSMGKAVFSARAGETLEIYREDFKEFLISAGLPVNEHEIIYGYDKLEKYLTTNENKWVKTSIIRGNGETFFWHNKKISASRLDSLRHDLGAFKNEAVFVIEEPIPDAVEIGYDGFCIDGKFPALALTGIEVKDTGYLGGVVDYKDLPLILKQINKALEGPFAGAGYKCFFSNEVRWTGKKGYFIDTTNRMPQPPGDLQMELYENFSEAVWQIANGIVPELKPIAKFGAQIIIKSDWATDEPQAIYFPKKHEDRVKIKNLMYKDDIPYYIPCDIEMSEIGSVCGFGDSIAAAIKDATEIAKTVEGDCIHCDGEPLNKAFEQIKKLQTFGINLF
jgi:hypothetical protein